MQSLDEKMWMPSVVDEVFTSINSTKGKTTAQLIEGDDVPYIAAAKTNNGCAGVYSSKPYPEWVSDGNAIVFVQLGDGAAGLAHYVPMPFIGMSGKTSCGYFQSLNEDNGIFIARCLSANKAIFSHGHSWTGNRLKKTKFMLPVTDSGEPDYEYMAEYTRQKRDAMLDEYRKYVEARIEELGELVEIPVLGKKEWNPFSIVELFPKIIPGRGKGLNHLPKVNTGGVNYIGATNRNNGVLCYVEEDDYSRPMILDGNCIGFIKNGDGSAGFAIYKAEKFISTSDVLYGYADWLNRFTGIFFVTAQDMIEHKYSHGYKRNKEHLAGDKVMLPIDDSGEPDYAYMEQYAKNMMLRKYKQYLEFINRQNVAEVD